MSVAQHERTQGFGPGSFRVSLPMGVAFTQPPWFTQLMPRTKRMTKAELVARLNALPAKYGKDLEAVHCEADGLLVDYINDPEVSAAFNALDKWYA